MPPNRTLHQTAGDPGAMQLLLQQILDNQDKFDTRQEEMRKDIATINETLRDGSGQFRAVNARIDGHDAYHARKDEAEKAGPHWLVKAAGTAAAGAIGVALMWFLLRGVVENGSISVHRSEAITKETK